MTKANLDPCFTVHITCFASPYQLEGTIGKRKWFFRSRHGHWILQVDENVVAHGYEELVHKDALTRIVYELSDLIHEAGWTAMDVWESGGS